MLIVHIRVKLWHVLLLALITATVRGGEISLGPGWNLITVPLSEASAPVDAYLAQNLIAGSLQKIWTYDNGWFSYVPDPTKTQPMGLWTRS